MSPRAVRRLRHNGAMAPPRAVAPDRDAVARQLRRSLLALLAVLVAGSGGYWMLGFTPLDAVYQAVTTVTTVGFREVVPFGPAEKAFTIVFVLVGVGVVLYTLTGLLGLLIEGWAGNEWGRRRMVKQIGELQGHAIVCGWGRVGRAAAHQLSKSGVQVVVCDSDPGRLVDCPYPHLEGDATRDEFLRLLGVERARVLVATLDTDASSLFVTLTARALNPTLVIIARSRVDDTEQKLLRAGADRVVNPQRIGGNRIAAFALQPHVTDFLDVAMHDEDVEFRLEQVVVHEGALLAGSTVREARLHEGDGALLLAMRQGGEFRTNPPPDTVVQPGDVVIVIGTAGQIDDVRRAAGSARVDRG